jgi:hypothetical protein
VSTDWQATFITPLVTDALSSSGHLDGDIPVIDSHDEWSIEDFE